MKSYPSVVHRRALHCGFTLLELLVVMIIIAILAGLTLAGFRYAQQSSARNRTVAAHATIRAALEQYKEKFGEYPEPSNPQEQEKFAGSTFYVGGAHMLYQAITGDGNNAIEMQTAPEGGVSESDGDVDDNERENVINFSGLPKAVIFPPKVQTGQARARFLVDGWGRPFQYTKANPDANQNTAVNPTYDLWSFGPLSGGRAPAESLESKKDLNTSASWITNWR